MRFTIIIEERQTDLVTLHKIFSSTPLSNSANKYIKEAHNEDPQIQAISPMIGKNRLSV